MSTKVVRETFDGPPKTVDMADMSREELLHWASLGSDEAVMLLLGMERPKGWQERMADRMGRARGQA